MATDTLMVPQQSVRLEALVATDAGGVGRRDNRLVNENVPMLTAGRGSTEASSLVFFWQALAFACSLTVNSPQCMYLQQHRVLSHLPPLLPPIRQSTPLFSVSLRGKR